MVPKLFLFLLLLGNQSLMAMTCWGRLESTPVISAEGATLTAEVQSARVFPRGAALITSSGNLADKGITAILHVAIGSTIRRGPHFDPSLKGVTASLKNALLLAQAHGHKRVALSSMGAGKLLPFMRVKNVKLVKIIIQTVVENRGDLQLRFVFIHQAQFE
ncbi:MAG: macro domain-containing protein, partial [Pseudomonadota bacterium]